MALTTREPIARGRLSLRNHNAQVGEIYAMLKALNQLTGLGMPETCHIN